MNKDWITQNNEIQAVISKLLTFDKRKCQNYNLYFM